MNANKIDALDQAATAAWALALPDEVALNPQDTAVFLTTLGPAVKPNTLSTWRSRRSDGPQFIRLHGRISYRVGHLRQYLGLARSSVA